jgi:hypothetical protein
MIVDNDTEWSGHHLLGPFRRARRCCSDSVHEHLLTQLTPKRLSFNVARGLIGVDCPSRRRVSRLSAGRVLHGIPRA